MVSLPSLLKKTLNFNTNCIHIEDADVVRKETQHSGRAFEQLQIVIKARPYKREQRRCPVCGRKCQGYDHKGKTPSEWRAPNLNGIPVIIQYRPMRIECPEHHVLTERIPWADGTSRFTADFNNEVAWLVGRLPKSAIATYEGINWRTVGNCVNATLDRIEPDRGARLHRGLKRICVDETSYKKGYKYITVVYDMDAGQVVWVHENQGYEVFKLFCEELTEEERANIGVIAGDGAKWIDQCKDEYFRNATRCMDPFHVCTWATEAVDRVRIDATRKAARECRAQETAFLKEEEQELGRLGLDSIMAYVAELDGQPEYDGMEPWKKVLFAGLMAYQQPLSRSPSGKKGKRRKKKLSPEHQAVLDQMEGNARALRNSRHALGHAPENCTEKQTEKIQLIANSYPELYRAYQLKESLRLILHMKDYVLARDSLEKWIADAAASGIAPMAELSEKIGRHKENILNAIRCHANSARSEATNTTIKLLVRMARGFRNQDNLIALIYLKCSSLVIPLNNRWQVTCESAAV